MTVLGLGERGAVPIGGAASGTCRNGGKRWNVRRENVKDRQNRQCLLCGRHASQRLNLEVHHVKKVEHGEAEKAVKEHKAERHARGFTSWGQFMAMLFCQLGRAHSLREICGGLACCEGQLKHLGVPGHRRPAEDPGPASRRL